MPLKATSVNFRNLDVAVNLEPVIHCSKPAFPGSFSMVSLFLFFLPIVHNPMGHLGTEFIIIHFCTIILR